MGEALSPDGLSLGLVLGPSDAVGFGLPFGLGAGLIGFFLSVIFSRWDGKVRPAETILWSWRGWWHHLRSVRHLRNVLLLSILFALTVGTIQGFSFGVSAALATAVANNGLAGVFHLELLGALLGDIWTYGMVSVAWPLGLSISLSYWFLLGLFQSVSSDMLDDKDRHVPNQGIRNSASNCARVGMVIGLASSFTLLLSVLPSHSFLLIALFAGNTWLPLYRDLPSQVLLQSLWYLLPYLLSAGLVCGLIAGLLVGGGLACGRHYILRFQLWRSKSLPWNYPRFLDYCAERILLRKVGGGYIFVHRLLLEYFADLEQHDRP